MKPEQQKSPDQNFDSKTDKIVDDIVAKEGDDLLAADDEKLAEAFSSNKPSWQQKIKSALINWWQNPVARWSTLTGVGVFLIVMIAIPPSRYFLLNSFGVRSKASLNILDASSQQPLKNVQVNLGGQSAPTDKDGNVTLQHIKLGSTLLKIDKRGYAVVEKHLVVGWGSNPLGTYSLTPQGTQFVLSATDFLSGKPIAKAEATSGDADAISDDKGIIKITIDKPADEVELSIKGNNYREEKITFSSSTKDIQNVKLVPDRPAVFVSKRSGKYDLYKIDADGKNEKLLLAGTGLERDDLTLVPNSVKNVAALVSSRENVHDADGYLLATLTLVNVNDGTTTKVAQSQRIQLIGWSGDRLVYVQVAAGASAANPKRNRIISYDLANTTSKELASANYFNDMQLIGDKLYYAPSGAYETNGTGLFKISVDGTNKQTITSDEIWNMFRLDYDHLTLSLQDKWESLQLSNNNLSKLSGAPANTTNRLYTISPDGKHVVWVDSRDGKGVLLSHDISANKDNALQTQNGLTDPVYWLTNNTLIYRVVSGQETADYVLNIDGGKAQKVHDVTNAGGIGQWYYY